MELALPFQPPVDPMLAVSQDAIPDGDGWLYEPKWDGFRAIVYFDGTDTYLQSRDSRPLGRYFPELGRIPVVRDLIGAPKPGSGGATDAEA